MVFSGLSNVYKQLITKIQFLIAVSRVRSQHYCRKKKTKIKGYDEQVRFNLFIIYK